jgi:hypothetical protein
MSDFEDSDSDLRRAIALSLEDAKAEVIDLSSDDDDLDRPFTTQAGAFGNGHKEPGKASKDFGSDTRADIRRPENKKPNILGSSQVKTHVSAIQPSEATDSSQPQSQHRLSGLLGLDRKRMEEERSARAQKRNASSISPPPLSRRPAAYPKHSESLSTVEEDDGQRARKRAKGILESSLATKQSTKDIDTIPKPGPGLQTTSFSVPRKLIESERLTMKDLQLDLPVPDRNKSSVSNKHRNPQVLSYTQQKDLLAPGIHFPDGVVKKTWAFGCPRQNDIKIEEILQKDDLELAVLSAFQWNEEWIFRKLNMRKTKIICVVQAEREEQAGHKFSF